MIRGSTRLIVMLGTPLFRVRAPTLFSAYFENVNVDAVMVPMEVVDDYASFVRRLLQVSNVVGAMVTFPYKRSIEVLDSCSPAVEVAQACNVIVRKPDGTLFGDIFDGVGFVSGLERAGFRCEGARALLVGSGGAGAAIAAALIDAGVSNLGIHNRNRATALAVLDRLKKYAGSSPVRIEWADGDPQGYDLIVNSTPLGMNASDPLPIDVTRLSPGATVADIVMGQETPLLRAAAVRGCRTQPGTKMLFEQVSSVSQFWGYPPVAWDEVQQLTNELGWTL